MLNSILGLLRYLEYQSFPEQSLNYRRVIAQISYRRTPYDCQRIRIFTCFHHFWIFFFTSFFIFNSLFQLKWCSKETKVRIDQRAVDWRAPSVISYLHSIKDLNDRFDSFASKHEDLKSDLLITKNWIHQRIIQLETNSFKNAQYHWREPLDGNLVPGEIRDKVLEETVRKPVSLSRH